MAIRSGGPPRGPKPPPSAASTRRTRKTERAKAAEQAGHDPHDGFQDASGHPGPALPRNGGSQAVLRQTVAHVEQELTRLETEVARILASIAGQGLAPEQFRRQRAELDRLRAALDAARRKLAKGRRALRELDSGFDQLDEPDLSELERDLAELERSSTEWGRALGAFETAAELAREGEPRRVPLRGAEKQAAMSAAEAANPTTVLADLAAAALRMTEAPSEPVETEAGAGGRFLGAQSRLAQMIAPDAEPIEPLDPEQ